MILELLRLEVARLGLDDMGGKFQHVLWNLLVGDIVEVFIFFANFIRISQRDTEKTFAARFERDDVLARGEHNSPKRYHAFLVDRLANDREPDALLHHSDRGSQYTSEQFQRLMADSGVVCSMSRSGNVWDNAAMESFFSSLKTERISNKTYRTRNEAKADVFDYIEHFYNSKRRHSTIGYLSPMEFERQAGFA